MKFEFSAGGVVFKREDGKIFVLLAQHSQHHGWVFPKGLIGDREDNKHQTKEETALREVEEETGVVATILEPLTPVVYWYQWEGEKRKKTVYYYVMKFVSGDFAKRDHEMEDVEWLPIDDVEERLTYPSDKKVWAEARKVINNLKFKI
jgi:8-oxo-dGTP diphosphatase